MDARGPLDPDGMATVHPFRRTRDAEPDEGRFAPPGETEAPASKLPEIRWHGDADPHADRDWLVRDLIPETGKGLISGQWGAGKTFGALDLSASVMTLTAFANRRSERQGGVLFIAPEGAFEIPIRLRGLIQGKLDQQAGAGRGKPIDLNRLPFAWIEECPRLVERASLPQLRAIVAAVAARLREAFDLPLVLIIIDTVAAGAGFDDENSAAETQKVMDAMQALSRETGAFVMGVDHFGKTLETGTRGSSAKEGAADTVLAFLAARDEAGNVSNTRMALRKLRGGRVGMETPYSLDVVQVGETFTREPITTCFVNWQPPRGAEIAAATVAKNRWPKTLRVLRASIETVLVTHGKRVRPYGHEGAEQLAVGRDELRTEFVAAYPADGETEAKRLDAKRNAFNRAVKTAVERELVGSRELGGVDHFWMVSHDEE